MDAWRRGGMRWRRVSVVAALTACAVGAWPLRVAAEESAAERYRVFREAFGQAVTLHREGDADKTEAALKRVIELIQGGSAQYGQQQWRDVWAQLGTKGDTAVRGQVAQAAQMLVESMPLAEVWEMWGDVAQQRQSLVEAVARYGLAIRFYNQRQTLLNRAAIVGSGPAEQLWQAAIVKIEEVYRKLWVIASDRSLERQARVFAIRGVSKLFGISQQVPIQPAQDLVDLMEQETDPQMQQIIEVTIRQGAKEAGIQVEYEDAEIPSGKNGAAQPSLGSSLAQ